MNKQQLLDKNEYLRQAYLNDIANAQKQLRELNIERQNLIMSED